ncbi:MAG: signal peptide peptidase SppA [Candidatus Staskawiczbacteria bacterium]|nr:signal peptide peptidase SppA [Candidatus Staskawiczbacteria bacterium]
MQEKVKKILKVALIVFMILTALAFWTEKAFYLLEYEEDLAWLPCHDSGDLAIIEIKGEIVTYFVESDEDEGSPDAVSSEDVVYCLDKAKKNSGVKGVIFEIDSRGGSPVASEEVMNVIKSLGKPTVSVIRESGLSGAYLIASATDRIFASELSDIGSIGVSMSYLDHSQQNENEGIIYQQLSSGKFKDTGDPDKPLSAEEKELFQRDLKILHEAFVKNIAKNRKIDITKVEKMADGSSMLGQMAKENGLIDEIGNTDSAKEWINK